MGDACDAGTGSASHDFTQRQHCDWDTAIRELHHGIAVIHHPPTGVDEHKGRSLFFDTLIETLADLRHECQDEIDELRRELETTRAELRRKQALRPTDIVWWKIDSQRYVITPVMSDGNDGAAIDARSLFEEYDAAKTPTE